MTGFADLLMRLVEPLALFGGLLYPPDGHPEENFSYLLFLTFVCTQVALPHEGPRLQSECDGNPCALVSGMWFLSVCC